MRTKIPPNLPLMITRVITIAHIRIQLQERKPKWKMTRTN